MKSVDLQTTVARSTEVGRDLRVQTEQNQQQAQDLALKVSRQSQHASETVRATTRVEGNRVESKNRRRGKGRSGSRKKKARERGTFLDVTCDS